LVHKDNVCDSRGLNVHSQGRLAQPSRVRYPLHMAQSKLPEDLEQRLLALAPADRLALATRLLASVEGLDPDRDEAWSAELDRRDAEFDSRAVVGIRR